jgi:hypothetical protein
MKVNEDYFSFGVEIRGGTKNDDVHLLILLRFGRVLAIKRYPSSFRSSFPEDPDGNIVAIHTITGR